MQAGTYNEVLRSIVEVNLNSKGSTDGGMIKCNVVEERKGKRKLYCVLYKIKQGLPRVDW